MRKFLLLKSFLGLMLLTSMAWAQERTVSGKVTSQDDGSPLPGVNVILKGTSKGTATDAAGAYSLSIPESGAILSFSFIGYKNQEVEAGARSVIDVVLLSDQTQLEEIVVTGYGSTLKKEFSGVTSTVSAKDIEKLPILSAQQALQGQATGVMVTTNSGTPGGGISVRIRGQTSLNASNDPLYVIDGVPVISGNLSQGDFGGQVQNALAGLNPQDIASMEVLKDAASAAIYGSRAANGVVLITTKRGNSGAAKINFSAWTGWGSPTKTVKTVSAQEWVNIRNEARVNSGLPAATNAQLGWDGVTNTDWIKEVFRTARISEYQLNISGGDDKTKYYISGSWRDEEGTLLGSGYERGTMRVNLDHKASSLFSFGTSLSIASDLNKRIQNDNNIYGIYSAAVLTPSTKRVRDENGEYVDALPSFNTNAVRDALITRAHLKTIKFIGNFYANFHIMNGLDFRTDFSYDYNAITEDYYNPASSAIGRPEGNGEFSYRTIGTSVIEPTLRYAKTINEVHSLNAVAGMTFQNRIQFDSDVNGVSFARETLGYLNSAATINTGGSSRTDYKFNSVFGRVNYAYKEKYIASGTFRRDGSSRFGPSNKFGNFFAVSAGWNFSEEDFMKNYDWLSLGKLRASYGSVGNDGVGNFPWQGTWVAANYLGRAALDAFSIANQDLKWETTTTLDLGIELALFNNRANINFGYFNRKTTDLLFSTPLPLTTGFASVTKNIGEMENRGFELELSGVIVNSPSGFKWRASANATFLKNKVVKLIDGQGPILSGFGSAVIVGQPLNTFYGLKFLGVDPATGTSLFQDVNGDGKINTTDDSQVIGKATPDMMGGFTNTFTYKGFTLDVFFNFVTGMSIYNNTQMFTMNPGNGFGMTTEMNRRWKQPGDITDVPKAETSPGLNASTNSRWLSPGDYLRLKNITLAYDFPSSMLTKVKLRSFRVYVTGQNLLTFTRYSGADPEVSVFANTSTAAGTDFLTFPQTKMFSVGVNLGF